MNSEPSKALPELRLLKGSSDQPPERQIRRQEVINVVKEVFEIFGFDPLETPILSYFDVLAMKYGPGDPILEEIFHVTDRGKRDLGLRYDLTIPFCRYIGMALQGHFALPFKRYEIGRVFRDGPIREGRLREFVQCDADVVGTSDPASDAECLAMADLVFQRLGLEAEIELNNRKILWAILQEAGLDEAKRDAATTAVDKWDKVGQEAVTEELNGLGLGAESIARIFQLLTVGDGAEGTIVALEETLKSDLGRQGLAELRGVLEAASALGVAIPIRIVPRLARGLGIYTGTVFEFFCRDREIINSSLGSGGRYERTVGEFLHPNEPERQGDYPGAGVSFGIEPICVALDKIGSQGGARKTVVQVLAVPMAGRSELLRLVADLRRLGVKTEIDLGGTKLKKVFKRANTMGIPYLLLLGEDELAESQVTLRDMNSGEQTRLPIDAGAIAARVGKG